MKFEYHIIIIHIYNIIYIYLLLIYIMSYYEYDIITYMYRISGQ